MKTYDDLVIGSGVSGMTLSLLLAYCGRRVLLVEKSSVPGGSMQRFHRGGVPFDTGFHFTANFTGCMGDMMRVLRMTDRLECIPIPTRLILGDFRKEYRIPRGRDRACEYLCGCFPGEAEKIRTWFLTEKKIYDHTPLFHLSESAMFSAMTHLDEDFISLADFRKRLALSPEAALLLECFATCHGTPPSEISLADHCRISYGLMDDLVRVRGGGGAFVEEFLRQAEELGIEIRTNCTLADCLDVEKKQCRRVRLTDGEEVAFENCVFTVHPKEILSLLPPSVSTSDFRARIGEFGESCGFFTVFCKVDREYPDFRPELSSYFSRSDMEAVLNGIPGASATGIMLTDEVDLHGNPCHTVTAFETVSPEETARWNASVSGRRPADYLVYKQRRAQQVMETVLRVYPGMRGHLRCMDSASMLTYRDYLSPFGSAYGIRQKAGQFNLFGKLPIRNFYAAGQSALLPGAMGAMLSSFLLWRRLAGEDSCRKLLKEVLS